MGEETWDETHLTMYAQQAPQEEKKSNCCCIGTIMGVVLVIVAVVVIFLMMGGSYESQTIAAMRAIRQHNDKKDAKTEAMKPLQKTYDDAVKGLVEEYAGKKAEEDAKLAERLNKEKFTSSAEGAKEGSLFQATGELSVKAITDQITAARTKKAAGKKDDAKKAKKEETK